ncbi:MAG: hypothetical protein IT429_14915 [Gemmataceae bacterium]|nr:hypothetical protein [Gemmataceae bacterium]
MAKAKKKTGKRSAAPKKPKATAAEVLLRTEEILRIRLDGAEIYDVREYVREKEAEAGSPWHLGPRQKPLSDSQLWRYIAAADRMLAENCRASRKKVVRRHLAQRRNLYGKAMVSGDLRTALGVLQDEARLLGLYPAAKHEVRTDATVKVIEDAGWYGNDAHHLAAAGAAAPGAGAPQPGPVQGGSMREKVGQDGAGPAGDDPRPRPRKGRPQGGD